MNTNTLLVMALGIICITIIAAIYGPDHKAEEIKACMMQPGMQYIRDFGTHYECVPVQQNE